MSGSKKASSLLYRTTTDVSVLLEPTVLFLKLSVFRVGGALVVLVGEVLVLVTVTGLLFVFVLLLLLLSRFLLFRESVTYFCLEGVEEVCVLVDLVVSLSSSVSSSVISAGFCGLRFL